MRPVARIAQSVEQGIENPRVLGSIPSPGTTILKNPPTRRVFAFWDSERSPGVLNTDVVCKYPFAGNILQITDHGCQQPARRIRLSLFSNLSLLIVRSAPD